MLKKYLSFYFQHSVQTAAKIYGALCGMKQKNFRFFPNSVFQASILFFWDPESAPADKENAVGAFRKVFPLERAGFFDHFAPKDARNIS